MVSNWFILGKNDTFRDTEDADPAREMVSKWFIFGQKQSKRTPLDKNTSGKRVTPVPLLSVKTAEDC